MGSDAPTSGSRLVFIDNLRTTIIILVIMLHLSITYGGEGTWYYMEANTDRVARLVLTIHNAIVQSFFMGCLFLISGYFTVISFDRKGPRRFLIDRVIRLGIPMLVFDFVIQPFLIYWLVRHGVKQLDGSFGDWAASYYTSFHPGRGPLWFVEALLLFSLAYVFWRLMAPARVPIHAEDPKPPRVVTLVVLALFLGITTFLVRVWTPIGWSFKPLNFQICFFPQYIVMFILGIVAYRRQWLIGIPKAMGGWALALAGVSAFVLCPAFMVLGAAVPGDVSTCKGGLHWQALTTALWEQGLGVLLIVGLIVLFRERLNRPGWLSRKASANSYAVFVIHTPVLIVFTLLVRDIHLYPLVKFTLVTLIVVPLCFSLAALIRQLPGVQRVL